MSKIGKINITIPEKVKVALAGNIINIEGPLGKKSVDIDLEMFNLDIKEGKEISIKPKEINQNSKFSDNSSRAKNMDELKIILEKKLSSRKTNEWVSDMEKNKIPCGPIFNIKEAVENPQVESRNMIVKAHHKVIGDFKLAGNPIKMSTYKDEKTRGDIPDLDEHRKKILKEFNN